jgi:hypothetical protein
VTGGATIIIFVTGSATTMSSVLSGRTGDGQVTITFDPSTDACPVVAPTAAFTG